MVCGFFAEGYGESNFNIYLRKDKQSVIQFMFRIELHKDDIHVLYFIKEKLGCGHVTSSKTRNSASFYITKSEDLINKLFPIFENFPLNTTKHLDFVVFKKVLKLYKNKMHLTKTGLDLITTFLANFNTSAALAILKRELILQCLLVIKLILLLTGF